MTPVVNTTFEDLPCTVAGLTVENDDASYTIILNARVSNERAREAYEHEMRHILAEDFEKNDIQEIEVKAHERGMK